MDIAIINGTVVDGTGAPGVRADVGITDDRIVAVGDLPERAGRTIDAAGRSSRRASSTRTRTATSCCCVTR